MSLEKILIIGSEGNLGSYMINSFSQVGYKPEQLFGYDVNKPQSVSNYTFVSDLSEDLVKQANRIYFNVPTELIDKSMSQVLSYARSDVIVSGQTSKKEPEMKSFENYSKQGQKYAPIHSMFNPQKIENTRKGRLLLINHPSLDEKDFQREIEFYSRVLSDNIKTIDSCEAHDLMTAHTQVNTSHHSLSTALSYAFMENSYSEKYSEKIFKMIDFMRSPYIFDQAQLSFVMRALDLPAHVFSGIQFGNEKGLEILENGVWVREQLSQMIDDGNKNDYLQRVMDAKDKLFSNNVEILSGSCLNDLGQFEFNESLNFNLISYAVNCSDMGIDMFESLKAQTPNYLMLLSLTDKLFKSDMLEKSVDFTFAQRRKSFLETQSFITSGVHYYGLIRDEYMEFYEGARQHSIDLTMSPYFRSQFVELSQAFHHFCQEGLKEYKRKVA